MMICFFIVSINTSNGAVPVVAPINPYTAGDYQSIIILGERRKRGPRNPLDAWYP